MRLVWLQHWPEIIIPYYILATIHREGIQTTVSQATVQSPYLSVLEVGFVTTYFSVLVLRNRGKGAIIFRRRCSRSCFAGDSYFKYHRLNLWAGNCIWQVQSIKEKETQQIKCPNCKYSHRTQPICQKYYLWCSRVDWGHTLWPQHAQFKPLFTKYNKNIYTLKADTS